MSSKTKPWAREIIIFILLAALFLFIVKLGFAAFISDPVINPGIGTIYTDQNLFCHWTLDMNASVNVTWYRNGAENITYNTNCTAGNDCFTKDAGNVPDRFTTKDDVWMCNVSYYNGTALQWANTSVTIAPSNPTIPKVYLQNGSEVVNTTIYAAESSTTNIYLNSTSPDGDVVIYAIKSNSISCTIDQDSGIITCNPSQKFPGRHIADTVQIRGFCNRRIIRMDKPQHKRHAHKSSSIFQS